MQKSSVDMEKLAQFIVEANRATYASGSEGIKKPDGSTSFHFEQGDFRYHDNYFGGEPYGGRTVVHYKGKPLWMMVYYGNVVDQSIDLKRVYAFLREVLCGSDTPLRGPFVYGSQDRGYVNEVQGDLESFSGHEYITYGNLLTYTMQYSGGLVDRRRG
ncbi:MAG: hypothetical protein HGA67_01785 [Candidatus Yonathbacteria bacterium]|nr:hypothetical protein [Candidatus Yonathbacteria bacterium]